MVLEVNDAGQLVLPAELVRAAPRTRLEVERQGRGARSQTCCRSTAAPQHRSILDSWPTFPAGLGDPNSTFRREEIYDDDGR